MLQAVLQAAWAEILVEMASSFHSLDSPSKAILKQCGRELEEESPNPESFKDVYF